MLFLLLAACAPQKGGDDARRAEQSAEDQTFLRADSVQVTSPTNGATVESPFLLSFAAGKNVDSVSLVADGAEVSTADVGDGSLTVTLEDGLHDLQLEGFDADGAPLGSHALSIRVAAAGDSWVTLTSPTAESYVYNPVTFVVAQSADIATVEIFVDGASLGTTNSEGLLTAEVPGEGAAHFVEARGYNAAAQMRASDGINVTVEPGESLSGSGYNALVLDILQSYATDGTHDYYWPADGGWYGTTRDVMYRGTTVAYGDPAGRCYCVGLTWEVMLRAFDQADSTTGGDGTLNGLSVSQLNEFRVDWFVRDLYGDGVVTALENYGLGEQVRSWTDVEPGDFVQFWRNSGSGHSVIFMDWETNSSGDVSGFRYWSTQSSTDGIAYNSEYFGTTGSSVNASYFYVARALMPSEWSAF